MVPRNSNIDRFVFAAASSQDRHRDFRAQEIKQCGTRRTAAHLYSAAVSLHTARAAVSQKYIDGATGRANSNSAGRF